eukprot:CAMPEP_0118918032 /NCGR_PEP_ID=MMETSP1166-20130328/17671_1 /TAXON_ID=1104430 /ORGANISM="Chrysoreinhardia sp, Strain CCMP3193" /LENGTH=55 /DNA_ID=CAMNT_0006858275 /DNA_START=84 /DNA_END=251 /DNA_ORIENTATION=-
MEDVDDRLASLERTVFLLEQSVSEIVRFKKEVLGNENIDVLALAAASRAPVIAQS